MSQPNADRGLSFRRGADGTDGILPASDCRDRTLRPAGGRPCSLHHGAVSRHSAFHRLRQTNQPVDFRSRGSAGKDLASGAQPVLHRRKFPDDTAGRIDLHPKTPAASFEMRGIGCIFLRPAGRALPVKTQRALTADSADCGTRCRHQTAAGASLPARHGGLRQSPQRFLRDNPRIVRVQKIRQAAVDINRIRMAVFFSDFAVAVLTGQLTVNRNVITLMVDQQ